MVVLLRSAGVFKAFLLKGNDCNVLRLSYLLCGWGERLGRGLASFHVEKLLLQWSL